MANTNKNASKGLPWEGLKGEENSATATDSFERNVNIERKEVPAKEEKSHGEEPAVSKADHKIKEKKRRKPENRLNSLGWFITMLIYAIPGVNILETLCFLIKDNFPERRRWAKAAFVVAVLSTSVIAICYLRIKNMTYADFSELYNKVFGK